MTTVFERFGGAVSSAVESVKNSVSDTLSDFKTGLSSSFDMASMRRAAAKLPANGNATKSTSTPNVSVGSDPKDWRVRIGLGKDADYFYKAGDKGLLAPLYNTNGVIFPYTPNITTTTTATYSQEALTHSIYPYQFYQNSSVNAISVSGDFTAQSDEEAKYVLACIYFFRAASKMFYGTGTHAGNPPPVVFLNGYGKHYFPNVPCVITSFSHTMPNNVDYIETDISNTVKKSPSVAAPSEAVYQDAALRQLRTQNATPAAPVSNSTTRVPTSSNITITLMPVYSRSSLSKFDLEKFAKGEMLTGGYI